MAVSLCRVVFHAVSVYFQGLAIDSKNRLQAQQASQLDENLVLTDHLTRTRQAMSRMLAEMCDCVCAA